MKSLDKTYQLIMLTLFIGLGTTISICFFLKFFIPIWLSVFLSIFTLFCILKQFRAKVIGILVVILVIVYLLPFIHIPHYIWHDFSAAEPSIGFGLLAANPYMYDYSAITLTAMIGATGALGVGFGIFLSRDQVVKLSELDSNSTYKRKTLAFPVWILWVCAGVSFSIISAPQETVFSARYSESGALNENWNFSSAWMLSYVILTYAFIDAILEKNPSLRSVKSKCSLIVLAYVVIWLQLLRGDRESMSWVFGLLILYYYWADSVIPKKKFSSHSKRKIYIGICLIVVISMFVGSARSQLLGADLTMLFELFFLAISSGLLNFDTLLFGTWSAALLTPLSVAGDYIYESFKVHWGEDYLNILLSLPPGFLADAFGYQRPLDSSIGPAWEMRYGIGGIHATVLPFRNFLLPGVFIVSAIWATFFSIYEKKALKKISVPNLSFLVTVVMAAPHWLWYGEKAIINALIMCLILNVFYKISLTIKIVELLRYHGGLRN
jgi:hypothetical protein